MAIYMDFLDNITFLRNKDKELAEKLGLKISVKMDHLYDIWLKKGSTGEIISWKNPKFASQNRYGFSRGQEGDEIFIKYSPVGNENLICTLRLSEIGNYYCDAAYLCQKHKNETDFCDNLGNGCWLCIYKSVKADDYEKFVFKYSLAVRYELLDVSMNEIVVYEIQE